MRFVPFLSSLFFALSMNNGVYVRHSVSVSNGFYGGMCNIENSTHDVIQLPYSTSFECFRQGRSFVIDMWDGGGGDGEQFSKCSEYTAIFLNILSAANVSLLKQK